MQNQNPSPDNPLTPQSNISPTPPPATPPPAQYSYPPPPPPGEQVPAQYPYPPPPMTNGPALAQYPYPSPYQQYYPPYTPAVRSTSQEVITSSLIGGSIASGIDVLITLLLVFVPAVGSVIVPLYQFVPLLPAGTLSVGGLIISLIIALLCSPGLLIVGLRTIRKTGRMSSVMLACTLALVGFAVVDLLLIIVTTAYASTLMPSSFSLTTLEFWGIALLGWFADVIMAGMVGFGVAALGATIGKQQR